MGCPVLKVVKGNSGSSWLKEDRQEELYDTVKAIVEASTKPVTVKIRIGWDESSITAIETCKILEKAGVSLIAVHGRTRSQFYSGSTNYEIIKKCK
jgi:tRNA-dihydrouridine synthase B